MYIGLFIFILLYFPSIVYLCSYQLNEINGTIIFPTYDNNIQCTWIFNLSLISNNIYFQSILITFHYFDTEFGHDELLIGETITDISKYNSKFYRFSGSKIPDPCLIQLRGDILTRSIWMEFTSDQTNTGSGFILDYVFQFNQSLIPTTIKSKKILIDAEIRHSLDNKSKASKYNYSFPYGSISSPNYPQNYSNNIICRWHIYHRNAFIRLYIDQFHTELHYDTLIIQLGQNLNNHAMIMYELSGSNLTKTDLFISNDNLYLIFNTDKSNNASGFFLYYEIIEKQIFIFDVYENQGIIHSNNYPESLRTNTEYIWNIYMNNSNEIEINLYDIHIDFDYDYLQILTGEIIYSLTTIKTYRLTVYNQTKLILRTKHSYNNEQYRGFNLTYQKLNRIIEKKTKLNNLPCGQKYSSLNGTIEFNSEILTSFDCLIFIEVDDGQNIFLRFDDLNWDNRENLIEIGLFYDPNQYQIFHISDAIPGTWFIANYSQIWIRFSSSQYSLGISKFRLFYSETIQWSTISPEPYVQILDNNRLFPYRLISLPTNNIYHNLTQTYIWHMEAFDDECIQINFQSFQSIDNRHICFTIKDFFQTYQICSHEYFPYIYHHIGSCTLSIQPEFIWILIQYNIQIDKFKKSNLNIIEINFELFSIYVSVTTINEINFKDDDDYLILTLPRNLDPFIHVEWLINIENYSSIIIFDIENFDGNTSAELIVPQNENTTKTYVLNKISSTRFSHILYSFKTSIRIIYKSFIYNQNKRLFRLILYKISRNYFYNQDFHYIFFKDKQRNYQWTIRGQYENSTFLTNLYSLNKNLLLETTVNINISIKNSFLTIPSSDFDIRYTFIKNKSSDFLLILYEQQTIDYYNNKIIILNKTSDVIQTTHLSSYYIQIHSIVFDSIDFIIIKADNDTVIRLYDFNSNINEYLILNSSVISNRRLSSLIGLRFSIRSLNIKLELQSLKKTPIELRYKTRISSNQTIKSSRSCFIIDNNLCNNNNQTCNNSCSHWFDYKSISMNYTRIDHVWPYALRGSVTLIIENTTIENFEKKLYRNLRQSIAKIVRQYCLKSQNNCLSRDTNAIRADHVIIQTYDEQIDNHRLYVAIFIKDPYRRTIALTNEQFFLALKQNRQEIYQDIKHHINLPTNISEDNSFDSIWLYGVCLLALLVLLVVILMLIMILVKKSRSTNINNKNKNLSPIQTVHEQQQQQKQNNLFCYHENETSESSTSTLLVNLPLTTTNYSTVRPSYFNSTIESAMKQHLDSDDEPIPFIDENLSTVPSRKSSVCWSDRTSLGSRFSLIWKFNRLRSNSQNRSTLSNNTNEKRRSHQHRTMQYTISPSQPNDEL